MAVGDYTLRPFTLPVAPNPVAMQTRNNDNLMRQQFNAHQDDVVAHVRSGTFAARPVSADIGSVYVCLDTQDTYTYTASGWAQTGWAHWYGEYIDTSDQTAGSPNVEQLVTIGTAGVQRGFSLGTSSKIIPAYDGLYNLQFSFQLANDSASDADVWIWPKVNGTAAPNTGGRVTVVSKHGSVKGHLIAIWNVYLQLDAGDEVQLFWETTDTACILETIAAGTYHPQAPSVIVTINRV